MNKGKFFIVATPIGNLKDITFRAVETLKKANLILAEDTRKSSILLNHHQIETKMLSYRDQNHNKVFPQILQGLFNGKNIALISDSGTPLISDPGFKLISELQNNDVEIITIPGPSALIAALSISGLPTDNFSFLGFLPKSKAKRRSILKSYGKQNATIIIYESPYRVKQLLEEIETKLGNRKTFVANELTKKFEREWRGSVSKIRKQIENESLKGEFCILVAKEDF